MAEVDLSLIGRGYHQAMQVLPIEFGTRIADRYGDPCTQRAQKMTLLKILEKGTPSDRELKTLGQMWLNSFDTTKEEMNKSLTRVRHGSVEDFIQMQLWRKGN